MGKPGKERQEIFGKIETEEQRILSAERKRKEKKAEIKSNRKKYQEHLEKGRMRKRKQKREVSVNLCTDRIPANQNGIQWNALTW